jgi:hypothetical protein
MACGRWPWEAGSDEERRGSEDDGVNGLCGGDCARPDPAAVESAKGPTSEWWVPSSEGAGVERTEFSSVYPCESVEGRPSGGEWRGQGLLIGAEEKSDEMKDRESEWPERHSRSDGNSQNAWPATHPRRTFTSAARPRQADLRHRRRPLLAPLPRSQPWPPHLSHVVYSGPPTIVYAIVTTHVTPRRSATITAFLGRLGRTIRLATCAAWLPPLESASKTRLLQGSQRYDQPSIIDKSG